MPRYYVDLQDGDELIADAEPVDLPDRVAVRLAALDALPDISPDEMMRTTIWAALAALASHRTRA